MNRTRRKSMIISCVFLMTLVLSSCEYYEPGSDQLISQLFVALNQFFEGETSQDSYQMSRVLLNEDGAELAESFCVSNASISYYKNNGDQEYYVKEKILYRKTNSTDEKVKTLFDESSLLSTEINEVITFIKSILKDDFIERKETEIFSKESVPYQTMTIEFKVTDINNADLVKNPYESINLVARYDMDNKIENVSIDFCNEKEVVSYNFGDVACTIDYPEDLYSYIDSEYEFTIE